MLVYILVDVLPASLSLFISDYSKHNLGVWDFYSAAYYSHDYPYYYGSDPKISICFSIVKRIIRNFTFNIADSLRKFQYIITNVVLIYRFRAVSSIFLSAKYSPLSLFVCFF